MLKPICPFMIAAAPLFAADTFAAEHVTTSSSPILNHLSRDAHAAIIVHHMKATSDDVTHLLESIEMGELLFGGRPIDQFKSMVGFRSAVNDHAGMAVAVVATGDDAEPFVPVVIVPVTDAGAFLDMNFRATDDGGYRHESGDVLYARTLGDPATHVAMSQNRTVAETYDPRGGIAQRMKTLLGERGFELSQSGDITVFVDRIAVKQFMTESRRHAPHGAQFGAEIGELAGRAVDGEPPAGIPFDIEHVEAIQDRMLDGFLAGLFVIDIDPLGVILHSFGRYDPESDNGRMLSGEASSGRALSGLPARPYYLAMSIDWRALGGEKLLDTLTELANEADMHIAVPEWMRQADTLDFAVYPSIAGLRGGILNEAIAIVRSSDSDAMRDAFRKFVQDRERLDDGIRRQVTWEESREVQNVGTAHAYEVRSISYPSDAIFHSTVAPLVFGPSGWRGFVKTTPNAMIVTFSQRPAVLAAALKRADGSPGGLADDAVVRAVQRWMPPEPDVQMYLGVGQVIEIVRQLLRTFGAGGLVTLPDADASLEPIGFGLRVHQGTIESSTIIPARIIMLGAEQVRRNLPAILE